LVGDDNEGGAGTGTVEKYHTPDQLPGPAILLALTRQWNRVALAKPVTAHDVAVIPDVSFVELVKALSVETCKRYDVAPADGFQLKVGEVERVTPFVGDTSAGAGSVAEKDQVLDQSPAARLFVALTRQ